MSFIVNSDQPAVRRVLVVDDDRALRRALVALLEASGFSVAEAADGITGLTQIQEHQFDLVILDLGLPHIPGLQILNEIRKLVFPPKVIVVTADDTAGTVLRAIRDHAYQYVVKPIRPKA